MTELTDLEICKRIAEIEGYLRIRVSRVTVQFSSSICDDDFELYNPLTDDALCFQLMVKYKVKFYSNKDYFVAGLINENGEPHCFNMDESPSKAICLAIIEAHKNDE